MNGWNNEISTLPGAHVLQTWEWGQFKAIYGWRPLPKVWRDEKDKVIAAAMILERSKNIGGLGINAKVLYVPRGPMLDWSNHTQRKLVLDYLENLARKERAIFIKMDPEVILGWGIPGSPNEKKSAYGADISKELTERGWRFSQDQIQFRNTVCIDLNGSDDEWLQRMKQKTRYNIRLAQKKGVVVRSGSMQDLSTLYSMYAETSIRDGFVIRSEGYYRHVWEIFLNSGMAEVLVAEVEGQAISGLILFFFGGKAWYLYGMSRQAHREKMPNYLLQWEAMRIAKQHGCNLYDLWGAPDEFSEDDSMWGVFRFKEGLGGEVVRFTGAWDFPVNRISYQIYTNILPRILNVMRRRGKARVQQEVPL